jgi:phosphoribosylanthranilate isomerase
MVILAQAFDMSNIKIQIYTAQSVEEALALADAGVDHVGITPQAATMSLKGLPGEINEGTAKAIREALRGEAVCVALTVETTLTPILEMAGEILPDVLHLCPLKDSLSPSDVVKLRAELPESVKIMQAISVAGWDSMDEAIRYAETGAIDYLILDTQAADIAGIGASGQTHDWRISAEIVRRVHPLPVILAGGLSPENVGQAIAAVKPYGVDSLTHTNEKLAGGGFRKDMARVKAFVEAAWGKGKERD